MKQLTYQQGLDLNALDILEQFQEDMAAEVHLHRRHKSRLRRQQEIMPRNDRRKAYA